MVGWVASNIVRQGGGEGGVGGGVVARLVSLLPLLATLLKLGRSRKLLLLRATPFPARVADAVLRCARVLREVGAGETGWTLAA